MSSLTQQVLTGETPARAPEIFKVNTKNQCFGAIRAALQDCADEPGDGGFVGEDPDDLGAALDLAVEALERVGNRYDDAGADVRLGSTRSWRMVRPSGTEAPGARK